MSSVPARISPFPSPGSPDAAAHAQAQGQGQGQGPVAVRDGKATRRRLTQTEVDLICARHDRLFRCKSGGARAVFAWCDLSGLSLRGRHLADADFTGAWLTGCDLSGAKLDNANLFGADLANAVLGEASLRRADLRGACLRGANLVGADLFEADLSGADLTGADLRDAVLMGVRTTMWRVNGAALEGALTDDHSPAAALDALSVSEMLREHARWCETGGAEGSPSMFDGVDLRPLKSIVGLNLTALSARQAVFLAWTWKGYSCRARGLKERTCALAGCGAPT